MLYEDGDVKIGILSLQGGFQAHCNMIKNSVLVRTSEQLYSCDGLIIPGGESTVMSKLIDHAHLRDDLQSYIKQKPVFGTCAGLILLSSEIMNNTPPIKPFSALDVQVNRNGYGRQSDSFIANINIHLDQKYSIEAPFIRAPKITAIGRDVKILCTYGGHPVCVQQGNVLGATFHPELSGFRALHDYFFDIVSRKKTLQAPFVAV